MDEVLELESELENALSWLDSIRARLGDWSYDVDGDGRRTRKGDGLSEAGYDRIMLAMSCISEVRSFYADAIKSAQEHNDYLADLADAQSY